MATSSTLTGARLHVSRLHVWHFAALAAVVLGTQAILFAVTPLGGRAGFLLVAAVLFGVALTAISASVEGRRHAVNRLVTYLLMTAFVIAMIPLVSVLSYTTARGIKALDLNFLTHSMFRVRPSATGGGAFHAIIGTVEQVSLATVIAVPLGLLVAIYIIEYGSGRLAAIVRFFVDVMTGLPSIVAGLFVYSFWVLGLSRGFSGLAAGIALSILMLPIVVRSTEEMLRLVPDSLREAGLALGLPRWRVIVSIVLPAAKNGITTGVMLAIARATGETAPVLLTAFALASTNFNPFDGAQTSLPTFIFDQAQSAYDVAIDRAWAAALTLIVIVLLLNLFARLLTRRNRLTHG
jgi:phosphate transport system permease protein